MLCRLVNKCIVEATAVHFLSCLLFRIEVSVDTNLHFTMKLLFENEREYKTNVLNFVIHLVRL